MISKLIISFVTLWYALAVDKSGVVVKTLAGSGSSGSVNSIGQDASFNSPVQVISNADGSLLYVIDFNNDEIRSIVTETANVATVAGASGAGSGGYVDGLCSIAQFNSPSGGALDTTADKLYITDTGNNVIRVLNITPCRLSTLAGSGTGGYVD